MVREVGGLFWSFLVHVQIFVRDCIQGLFKFPTFRVVSLHVDPDRYIIIMTSWEILPFVLLTEY